MLSPSSISSIADCWNRLWRHPRTASSLNSFGRDNDWMCCIYYTAIRRQLPHGGSSSSGSRSFWSGCVCFTFYSSTSSPPNPAPPTRLLTGATVVTGTISGKTITETYEPTTYTQFAKITAIITTTTFNAQRSPTPIVVGPSGVAWTPYHPVSGVPNVLPPSVLPGAPRGTQTDAKSSLTSNVPLPSGGTIVIATLGSSVFTETFVPATISSYASLASTITTTTFGPQSSPVTFLIGPGGIKWTPINLPSGVPEVPPPSVLPPELKAPANKTLSGTSVGSTDSPNSPIITPPTTKPTGAPPHGIPSTDYVSITDAFDKTDQSETTLVVGGVTEYWSKATFAYLSTITAPRTVPTSLVQTNKDSSKFTVSTAVIIVGLAVAGKKPCCGDFSLQCS